MLKKFFLPLFFALVFAAQGQTTYKRIVSLAPSLTQSLYFLGAQDLLVGCTNYCEEAKKDNKPVVATAVKLNIEKLLSVKPDLVLALGLSGAEDLETIRKFGIKVEEFQSPKSFDEICEQFINLGKMVGKQADAEKIVSDSRLKINEIKVGRTLKPHYRMFFQIGVNPIFSVLPHTFMNDYITLLNGENIASRLAHGTVGREFVIAGNPDCIFIAAMGVVGDEERKVWLKYRTLSASEKKQVFIVDAKMACQPTPITFVQTIEFLDQQLK
ncbi:MAG: helical backbone metal receptor [Dysgonamonadaceae bacterium]|nr:helical backbone metal receptor [Dysgonamonadaceae bacterium]